MQRRGLANPLDDNWPWPSTRPYIYLRIEFPNRMALGPNRVALLEAIHRHGSISAAAKARKVTYRRAWDDVQYLNEIFDKPLIEKMKGQKGGARLTKLGVDVLTLFRQAESATALAIVDKVNRLGGHLKRLSQIC